MNKHLIVLAIAILLICVGLSGCEDLNLDGTQSTTLSDGTEVTGDIGRISILEHNL